MTREPSQAPPAVREPRRAARTLWFWLLLIAFIGLGAWWCVYFPYDEALIYGAVPANARFIGEHDDLAGRWRTLGRSAVVRNALAAYGVRPGEIDEVVEDPAVHRMVQRFASRKTVVAYSPAFGPGRDPCWILASWAGTAGQFLKWGMSADLLSDFRKVNLPDGATIWVLEDDDGARATLSVAVAEGVLVGCYSADPMAVRGLTARMERGSRRAAALEAPPFREAAGRGESPSVASAPSVASPGAADRGWFSWYQKEGRSLRRQQAVFSLSLAERDDISGRLWTEAWPDLVGGGRSRAPGDSVERLRDLLGPAPCALALAPLATIGELARSLGASREFSAVLAELRSAGKRDALAFVALSGGDYDGRLLGIRVPTLFVGVEVADGADETTVVRASMDRLNGQFGWGLIPRQETAGERRVVVLDSSRSSLYAGLRDRDKPALALRDGWLVGASNMGALQQVLDGRETDGTPWARGLDAQESSVYGWVDFEAASESVGNIIAVYSMLLMVQDSASGRRARDELADVRRWLDAVRPLRSGFVWLDGEQGGTAVRFRLGEGGAGSPDWPALAWQERP